MGRGNEINNMAKTFTPLELQVIEDLYDSSEGNGHDFGFTDEVHLDHKIARGVLSSLVQKEVITIWEEIKNCAGTFHQFTWRGIESHNINSVEDILNLHK